MKRAQAWIVGVAVLALVNAAGAERPGGLSFENRLRFQYDDNVTDREQDTRSSIRITEEATLSGSVRLDNAFLSLRYRAELNWYDNREGDDLDINHTADLIWNHTVSRRVSFSLADTFRKVDLPELFREDGTLSRRDSSYIYNTLRGTVTTALTSTTRLDFSGRYVLTRYDDDVLAERDDYDLLAGGLTLHARAGKDMSAFVDLRAESIDYIGAGSEQPGDILFPGAEQIRQRIVPDRSSETFSGGVGVERVFGPSLVGVLRAGVSHKEYKAANTDSETGPYADTSLTYTFSPATRMTLGLSHQMFQSSLITYVNQKRSTADLRLAHDISARLQLTLAGSFVYSDYDRNDSVDTMTAEEAESGSETALTGRVRLSYQLASNHWLEGGWSHTKLDSDLRSDYRRGIVDVSWRVRL